MGGNTIRTRGNTIVDSNVGCSCWLFWAGDGGQTGTIFL